MGQTPNAGRAFKRRRATFTSRTRWDVSLIQIRIGITLERPDILRQLGSRLLAHREANGLRSALAILPGRSFAAGIGQYGGAASAGRRRSVPSPVGTNFSGLLISSSTMRGEVDEKAHHRSEPRRPADDRALLSFRAGTG